MRAGVWAGGTALGLMSGAALARPPEGVGVGVIAGDPEVLLSVAWRQSDDFYVQGALGWDIRDAAFHLTADYVLQPVILENEDAPGVRFPVYVGVGLRLRVGDDWNGEDQGVGVRVPVGMSVTPTDIPVEVFLELSPALILLPSTEGELDGGLGVRFYF